jgi:hypothetical protein
MWYAYAPSLAVFGPNYTRALVNLVLLVCSMWHAYDPSLAAGIACSVQITRVHSSTLFYWYVLRGLRMPQAWLHV